MDQCFVYFLYVSARECAYVHADVLKVNPTYGCFSCVERPDVGGRRSTLQCYGGYFYCNILRLPTHLIILPSCCMCVGSHCEEQYASLRNSRSFLVCRESLKPVLSSLLFSLRDRAKDSTDLLCFCLCLLSASHPELPAVFASSLPHIQSFQLSLPPLCLTSRASRCLCHLSTSRPELPAVSASCLPRVQSFQLSLPPVYLASRASSCLCLIQKLLRSRSIPTAFLSVINMDIWCSIAAVVWVLTLLISDPVCGFPSLPKDSCVSVSEELDQFRVQGEAVVMGCPGLIGFLTKRNLLTSPGSYSFLIVKGNGATGLEEAEEAEDKRVLTREQNLWLLPARLSDSGQYTCIYRKDSVCITGNITLQVYENMLSGIDKMHYPIFDPPGRDVALTCPHISAFNITQEILWFKDSRPTALPMDSGRYYRERWNKMVITDVSKSDEGFYTCVLQVHANNRLYTVSRILKLHIKMPKIVPQSHTTQTSVGLASSPTLSPALTPTSSLATTTTSTPTGKTFQSTVHTTVLQRPRILLPPHGAVFEGRSGAELEMLCKVLTHCQSLNSTMVEWLVDGQLLEDSNLDGRGLQSERRTTRVEEGCHVEVRLVIRGLTGADSKRILACVAHNQAGEQEVQAVIRLDDSETLWLMGTVGFVIAFLLVISVLLCHLLRPWRKEHYVLAAEDSSL